MKRKILTLSFVVVVVLATTFNHVGFQSKSDSKIQGVSLVKRAQAANIICNELNMGFYQCCKIQAGNCDLFGSPYHYGPIYF
ncbi:MAG: hypothetical protein JXR82_09095 [Marinifilaceae bacterium]|nr:hypothetical protein [Marinifilaceae bacterium]